MKMMGHKLNVDSDPLYHSRVRYVYKMGNKVAHDVNDFPMGGDAIRIKTNLTLEDLLGETSLYNGNLNRIRFFFAQVGTLVEIHRCTVCNQLFDSSINHLCSARPVA